MLHGVAVAASFDGFIPVHLKNGGHGGGCDGERPMPAPFSATDAAAIVVCIGVVLCLCSIQRELSAWFERCFGEERRMGKVNRRASTE